jgi:large subunit ribosomal protein L10
LAFLLSSGEEVKMNRQEKEQFVVNLHGQLEKARGTFLVGYKGLDVEAMNRLRRELKKAKCEFHVVKNRLLKLASDETETGLMRDHMEGPSAITVTYEDVVRPAKVLVDFAKNSEQLIIKVGQISGRVVDTDAIKRLAELPGKDVLLAQALAAMEAVPASFLRVMNGLILKLLNVLKAIEQK